MQRICIPRADCRRSRKPPQIQISRSEQAPASMLRFTIRGLFFSVRTSPLRRDVDRQPRPIRFRLSPGAELGRRDLVAVRSRDDQTRPGGLDPILKITASAHVRLELERLRVPRLDLVNVSEPSGWRALNAFLATPPADFASNFNAVSACSPPSGNSARKNRIFPSLATCGMLRTRRRLGPLTASRGAARIGARTPRSLPTATGCYRTRGSRRNRA